MAEQNVTNRHLGETSRDANDRPVTEAMSCPVVAPFAALVILAIMGVSKVNTFVMEPR